MLIERISDDVKSMDTWHVFGAGPVLGLNHGSLAFALVSDCKYCISRLNVLKYSVRAGMMHTVCAHTYMLVGPLPENSFICPLP